MTNFQAEMFNKKASDSKNSPDRIIKAIDLKQGQSVADIGAGGGYFSLRFAKIVGEKGCVYAVDKNQKFIDFISNRASEQKLNNIHPIIARKGILDLPEHNLDVIFMRNVTHHLSNRTEYFVNLQRFLKPDGKIIIIDYKPSKSFSFSGIFGHHVAKESIIQEMEDARYLLDKDFDFLPQQHFTIYTIP
jgi:ubiquinone/menaquinone biosynthesis C-methylase UbiE